MIKNIITLKYGMATSKYLSSVESKKKRNVFLLVKTISGVKCVDDMFTYNELLTNCPKHILDCKIFHHLKKNIHVCQIAPSHGVLD